MKVRTKRGAHLSCAKSNLYEAVNGANGRSMWMKYLFTFQAPKLITLIWEWPDPKNIIPGGGNNSHMFPIRGLRKVYKRPPAKFRKYTDRTFATWVGGKPMNGGGGVTDALLTEVSRQELNPNASALHFMRGVGDTSLYRASGNIEPVARMGRWQTSSMSAYLAYLRCVWGGELIRGLCNLAAEGVAHYTAIRAI